MYFKKSVFLLWLTGCLCTSIFSFGQPAQTGDSVTSLTLDQCIQYALKHQPAVNQALLGIPIAKASNAIAVAGWLPQVNVSANLTHYLELPTSFIKNQSTGQLVQQQTGVVNTVIPNLSVTQAIFSPSLVYAAKAAPLVMLQAQQDVDSSKIDLVVGVSKGFYALLQTLQQVGVLQEDTARLNKNLSDTYHQYIGGIVDETDYDEAAISLNNSKAQLKQATENIIPQYAQLKQAMGYPPEQQFNVSYDTMQMQRDIVFDTTQQLKFEARIEYKLLQTAKDMQRLTTGYYHNAWLPSLTGFFDYNYEFENNHSSDLYSNAYPYSYIGLSFNMPIFTGFARIQNERKSKLQEQVLDWSALGLKSEIFTEYTSALATYKSNLYNLSIMRENEALAKKTYFIVDLQYRQGVVPYLNVITAEDNLVAAEIGYVNALFQLLSTKIDLERAMGIVPH